VQTQVTSLNNTGTTVGFWSNSNNGVGLDANFGFVDSGGTFTNVNNPATPTTGLTFNQLLGVNDSNTAVGFYIDAAGINHGYTYNILTNTFSANIDDPNGTSTTAAAINNAGEIAGFYVDAGGLMHGFLDNGGTFTTVNAPGAVDTTLLGLNDLGQAVGDEVDAMGQMHGLIFNSLSDAFQVLDDPNGVGTTTLNGVNDNSSIVGFYVGGDDFTHGLLATTPEPGSLALVGSGLGRLALRRRRKAA
jgi:hypothetical protein